MPSPRNIAMPDDAVVWRVQPLIQHMSEGAAPPADPAPAGDKPADPAPAEDKPAEDKPAEDKPEDKPTEGKSDDDGEDQMNTDAGKRALRAERERRKELESLLAKMAEALPKKSDAKDDGATDVEALRQQLAEAQQQIAAAERRESQAKIAREKALPEFLAPLLDGDDAEAMTKKADELAASLAEYVAGQGKPKPSSRSTGAGITGSHGSDPMDPRKLAADVRGRSA